jgi:hypothetical protein
MIGTCELLLPSRWARTAERDGVGRERDCLLQSRLGLRGCDGWGFEAVMVGNVTIGPSCHADDFGAGRR